MDSCNLLIVLAVITTAHPLPIRPVLSDYSDYTPSNSWPLDVFIMIDYENINNYRYPISYSTYHDYVKPNVNYDVEQKNEDINSKPSNDYAFTDFNEIPVSDNDNCDSNNKDKTENSNSNVAISKDYMKTGHSNSVATNNPVNHISKRNEVQNGVATKENNAFTYDDNIKEKTEAKSLKSDSASLNVQSDKRSVPTSSDNAANNGLYVQNYKKNSKSVETSNNEVPNNDNLEKKAPEITKGIIDAAKEKKAPVYINNGNNKQETVTRSYSATNLHTQTKTRNGDSVSETDGKATASSYFKDNRNGIETGRSSDAYSHAHLDSSNGVSSGDSDGEVTAKSYVNDKDGKHVGTYEVGSTTSYVDSRNGASVAASDSAAGAYNYSKNKKDGPETDKYVVASTHVYLDDRNGVSVSANGGNLK